MQSRNVSLKTTLGGISFVSRGDYLIMLPNRKVAIDASMSIYQFLAAVRSTDGVLVNSDGDTTSHLSGLFFR